MSAKEVQEAARVLLDADVVHHLDGAGPLNGYGQEWMKRALTALLDAPVEIYGDTKEGR